MKITVNIDTYHPAAAIGLKWQMPSAPKDDGPSSLYLLPSELVPTQHPHAVKDMSRVAVFYDEHFTLFYAPSNSFSCDHRNEHAIATARAEVIYCDTFKLLDVVRKLHAKSTVAETVLDTDRFPTSRPTPPVLTVTQLAAHPNLRNRDLLGKTLQHFRAVLTQGAKESLDRCRTFTNLMADLSHYIRGTTTVAAMGDEFYFDGRRAGGCGFNGGIIPHTFDNSYGIHT